MITKTMVVVRGGEVMNEEIIAIRPTDCPPQNGRFYAGRIGQTLRMRCLLTTECQDLFGFHPLDLHPGQTYRGRDGRYYILEKVRQMIQESGEVWKVTMKRI